MKVLPLLLVLLSAASLAAETVLFAPDPGPAGQWSVSLPKPGRRSAASIPVPVERIAGKKVMLAAEIEQQDVSAKPNYWNGVKLMLVLNYADGKVNYPQAGNFSGTRPWTPHAVAVTVPADISSARIELALEEVSGTARFRNVRIIEDIPADCRGYRLTGSIDRANAEYRAGEEMKFTFRLTRDGKPASGFLQIVCAGDDGRSETLCRKLDKAGTAVVTRKLTRPGFAMVKATLLTAYGTPAQSGGRPIQYGLGGGVAADTLKPGEPEPEDFDAYWDRQKRALAAVPLKVLEKKFVRESNHCLIYDLKIACAGRRPVSGSLAIPKNAKPKSLPLRVFYQGYGVSGATLRENPAELIFSVNPHGIENGREQAYYTALASGELKSYGFSDRENARPESSYFNGMILRDLRALEFCRTLPEWDGETIHLSGGSQGAFQTVAVAALSDGISSCSLEVPWLCDLGGVNIGRIRGWRPNLRPGLGYFDTVNFAGRVKAPVTIRAGLSDWVCPPSGVWVLYNSLKAPARLTMYQGRDHAVYPAFDERQTPQTTYCK